MNLVEPESDRATRRQRLVVLCTLDRVELRLAVRPPYVAPSAPMVAGVSHALDVAGILPGSVGRWSRRLSTGLRLLRRFGAAP